MARPGQAGRGGRARPAADRPTIFKEITDKIMAQLGAGCVPWVQPWGKVPGAPAVGLPRNAVTRRRYSGVNVLILWGAVIERGFSNQLWLTFNQAKELGGSIRKGERGTTIVYASRFTPKEERERARSEGDDERAIPFLKRYTVFSPDQCDDLPADLAAAAPPPPENLVLPQVEDLIRASGATFRIGGERAFYDPARDLCQVPPPQAYFEPVNWHRTALHELGHWTGAPHRLGRDLSGRFGSKLYAREELVAEMAGAFCCASLGIEPTVRHADYVGDWLAVLREDDRAIVRAASAASKAADYLLAFADMAEEGDEAG